jgi:hypothetical protein
MNKRAISMVIAVVLLIMIAIVASSVSYYWLVKIQGGIQAGTERSHTELTEQVVGKIEIKEFKHDSNLSTARIIMQNIGSRELKDLGDAGDLIVISNEIHSCKSGFNSTYCDVCPFNLGIGGVEVILLNFTNTNCEVLRKGQKYDAYFALGDAREYTSFTADIIHS